MSAPLRILFTNNTLSERAGSELVVKDLAIAMVRRGHLPMAYSNTLGPVAEELRAATVPVVESLEDLKAVPDIIHGQHHLEAMAAMLHFPDVPAIFVCHGWAPWQEFPPAFPTIKRYIGVDDLCKERLLSTPGIDPELVEVNYNFVDLNRFKKQAELSRPAKSALVFSNYVTEGAHLECIRRACARFGIETVDVAGHRIGKEAPNPELLLPHYDVVFAKARCALEAMACGCAVVLLDTMGLGGMVTTSNMKELRGLNFGLRAMQRNLANEDSIFAELSKYDPDDADRVASWIRENAGLEAAVDQWIDVYQGVISDHSSSTNSAATRQLAAAAATYISFWSKKIKTAHLADAAKERTAAELSQQQEQCARLQDQADRVATELSCLVQSNADLTEALRKADESASALQTQRELNKTLQAELARTQAQLDAVVSSRAYRVGAFLRKVIFNR